MDRQEQIRKLETEWKESPRWRGVDRTYSAADVVKQHGAREIYVAATHGVLAGKALEKLSNAPLAGLVLTDTIPLAEEKRLPIITVRSVDELLGEAIKRIHHHQSISDFFRNMEA